MSIKEEVEKIKELKLYGIEKHSGYACSQHMNALKKYGYLERHRKSFNPVKSLNFQYELLNSEEKLVQSKSNINKREIDLKILLEKEQEKLLKIIKRRK